MDTDIDNEQLNSSSTSSSNNSSSSNLLANLPMIPILQSSDNDVGEELDPTEHLDLQEQPDVQSGSAGLPQPQPPPPPLQTQQSDNSVFALPLLFNNNTTPPPSSSSSSSSPTSSSHNLQLYHDQQQQQLLQEQSHSEHALHFDHSPSPSLQQHALLPPPPSPPLESQQPQHQESPEQQQQQLQTHQCAFNDTSTIADIIDASALEAVIGKAILSADIASTSQQQPHNQQQQRSQDQEQQPESLSGAQCSSLSVIGEVPAGSSALTERNKNISNITAIAAAGGRRRRSGHRQQQKQQFKNFKNCK